MRLALYGSLRPGADAHFQVRDIPGAWSTGTVQGWAYDITWGPGAGYLGITLDATGNEVPVDILESDRLESFWRHLDDFVGPGFSRVETTAHVTNGEPATVWIYEARPDAE